MATDPRNVVLEQTQPPDDIHNIKPPPRIPRFIDWTTNLHPEQSETCLPGALVD